VYVVIASSSIILTRWQHGKILVWNSCTR